MSIPLYMDVHIPKPIFSELRERGIDVLRAQEDGAAELPDSELLDRATSLGRVLFSQDADLLSEAAARHASGKRFSGVNYAHQLGITIGQAVRDLELIARVCSADDMENQVEYLPL